jgi:uroporphyrinogen decarboxylase
VRPRIAPEPDFARFRDVLLLKRAVRRPPLFDFHIAPEHKERLLGRPVASPSDEVEFYRLAGYDFVQATVHVAPTEISAEHAHHGSDTAGYHGVIHSLEQFRSQKWSWQDAAAGNLDACQAQLKFLRSLAEVIPDEMRIMLHGADSFTLAWMLMGFEAFCMATVDQPELVFALMDSLANAQINALSEAMHIGGDKIGVVLYSDDVAYTEGLMLAPSFFLEYLIPVLKRVAALGPPLVYHSDGRLYDVFDDLAEVGVRGIQPLEAKSMDPLEVKGRWPGKFCLIGNIDLDLMCRGTTLDVVREVRMKIDRLNIGGGYMVGVSNTVPDYVSYENYIAMIETVYSYSEGVA